MINVDDVIEQIRIGQVISHNGAGEMHQNIP